MSGNKYMPMPEEMTIGESYAPAMEITDPEDARQYLEALIERSVRCFDMSEDEARKVQLSNLGYYAGYYSYDVRVRVQQLFNAVHPIFGTTQPTADEAFQAGIDYANRDKVE